MGVVAEAGGEHIWEDGGIWEGEYMIKENEKGRNREEVWKGSWQGSGRNWRSYGGKDAL